MRDFKKRRTTEWWRVLLGCAGLLLLLAIAGLSVRAAWDMYGKFALASTTREGAERELKNVEERYAEVSASVGELSTPRGEEKELRERYGVARPGEAEIRVVREDGAESPFISEEKSVWRRMWEALFVW